MDLVSSLEHAFNQAADPIRASSQAAYMRNLFPYRGLSKPVRAELQKKIFRQHPLASQNALIDIILRLWSLEFREYQYAACDLAYMYRKLWTPEICATFEYMARHKQWWDSIDLIATKLIGPLVLKYPSLQDQMDLWIDDTDMWLRRTALIYQLSYKDKTERNRLFGYCEKRMHEKEFFIRKAIGWALRTYSRVNPQDVRAFITRNSNNLSPLSCRVAGKYC